MINELTDTNFWQEIRKSPCPYLVDFWAIWSQSCLMISQTLEDVARQYDGKLSIGKVNVDNEIKTANDCDIQNIPTLIFYSGGKELERIVGTITKEILIAKIKNICPKAKTNKRKGKK